MEAAFVNPQVTHTTALLFLKYLKEDQIAGWMLTGCWVTTNGVIPVRFTVARVGVVNAFLADYF